MFSGLRCLSSELRGWSLQRIERLRLMPEVAECAPLLAGTAPATAAKTAHPVRRTAGSALPDVGTTFAVPERPAKPVNPIAGLVPRPAETERALRWNSVKVARRIAEHAHPNVGTRPATTMKPV